MTQPPAKILTNGQASTTQMRHRAPLALALFGVLFAQVLLAIGLLTGLGAANLKTGFKDYQIARDTETLESFADITAQHIIDAGGLDGFLAQQGNIRSVLDELAISRGIAPAGRPEPPPPPFDRPETGPPLNGERPGMDRPPPPHPGRRDGFGSRVALYSPKGEQIDGLKMPASARMLERPIIVDGRVIALARVQTLKVSEGVDQRFLKGQTNSLIATGLVLILISAIASWLVAQLWARPLHVMQAATSRIAKGEFSVRMPVEGLREVAATTDNINQMATSLETLERARRVWLAEISHELRTPVTIMRAELESMMDGVRVPSPDAVTSLHEEILTLNMLIDDLHVIALGDTGRLSCTFEDVLLKTLIETAIRRFAPQSLAKGVAIRFEAEDGAGLTVSTDPYRLGQVLANILGNSVRYTHAPGQIVVAVHNAGATYEIAISDSPPGVSDDALEDMFESFKRLDPSRTKDGGGSGLGLAVCRTIVSALGGSIKAKHSDIGGVCVAISLPIAEARP